MDPKQSRLDTPIGKRIVDDFYVHRDYLEHITNYSDLRDLIQSCEQLLSDADLNLWNVIKIHRDRIKISFLQYLEFDNDPFPTLNGSWTVDWSNSKVTFRSYSNSLNPPILHRKELLVAGHHPNRSSWVAITKLAEDFGLFSTNYPIGFKENWLRLIEQKGLRLVGNEFLPIGNETTTTDSPEKPQQRPLHQIQQRQSLPPPERPQQ
jgi:DNA phosphorothioation-associated putative methyltransferase